MSAFLDALKATEIEWPSGTRSAVCLTFDIDAETMWTSKDSANADRPSVVSQGRYDVGLGLLVVLDFLDRNGLSSTFFVPSLMAEAHPEAIEEIVGRGHEVAHHGYDHTSVEGFTPEAEREALASSADVLAGVAGKRPVGYRAPLYGVTPGDVGILADLGFTYSANLMDSIRPYVHEGAGGLVEIPVQWVLDDGPYFALSYQPPNYRQPKLPREAAEAWCAEVRANAEYGGVTTLTLHPQLIGRPARIGVLQEVVDTANEIGGIWLPRMDELADHVRSTSGPESRG